MALSIVVKRAAWTTAVLLLVGCGGGDAAIGPGDDAAAEGSAPDGGTNDATIHDDASDAAVGHDVTGDEDGGLVVLDSATDSAIEASDDAATDAGSPCTPATFQAVCPIVACMTATSCVANVCQYTAQVPCVARTLSGTFTSGEVDKTIGIVTLHGNISEFRQDDGLVCVGSTCITGGITP